MAKTISYRLFGLGQVPKKFWNHLAAEQIIWLEEGVRGSVTLKKYKAPGKRASWRRAYFSASIGMTRKRIFAFAYSRRLINVPFDDERIKRLKVSVENNRCVCCAFDAAEFDNDRSGTVECRFFVETPADFLRQLSGMVRDY